MPSCSYRKQMGFEPRLQGQLVKTENCQMTYIVNNTHIMTCNVDLRVFRGSTPWSSIFPFEKLMGKIQKKDKFVTAYCGTYNINLDLQAALISLLFCLENSDLFIK